MPRQRAIAYLRRQELSYPRHAMQIMMIWCRNPTFFQLLKAKKIGGTYCTWYVYINTNLRAHHCLSQVFSLGLPWSACDGGCASQAMVSCTLLQVRENFLALHARYKDCLCVHAVEDAPSHPWFHVHYWSQVILHSCITAHYV